MIRTTELRRRPRALRVRAGSVAAAAVVLLSLTACGPSAAEKSLAACLPGTWHLQTADAAAGVKGDFDQRSLPIDTVSMNGALTLVVSRSLRAQVEAEITSTADGSTRDGRKLVLVQTTNGSRAATIDLDGDIARFGSVSGMLDEDLTARVDDRQTGRHYRMPSTAVIGRPGTLVCTDTQLTLSRVHGVTLTFTRG